ncbi:MAG: Rossmann-like and DUF2520 domain-containing protein [Acidobacteriaceae bacterium]
MTKTKGTSRVALVGSGSLAHALAELLPRAGYVVQEIVVRTIAKAALKLGRKAGAPVVSFADANWSAEIVWLAISDGAIREVAKAIAVRSDWQRKVVLHSSGALSSQELAVLRKKGASVASLHPMMTFVRGETPDMRGIAWTIEGDEKAQRAARKIVSALGGRALRIRPEHKPLYHAFGAFLSPLLVVHLVTASEVAKCAGIRRQDFEAIMKPIVSRTLENLFANIGEPHGAGGAFSGPLVRGDVETIRRHLRSLRRVPTARKLYIELVRSALHSELPIGKRSEIAKALKS